MDSITMMDNEFIIYIINSYLNYHLIEYSNSNLTITANFDQGDGALCTKININFSSEIRQATL